LGVWLCGLMTGVRSSRGLEAACRDQVPYLWLTGWQRPDRHTLWRLYRAQREALRARVTGAPSGPPSPPPSTSAPSPASGRRPPTPHARSPPDPAHAPAPDTPSPEITPTT